MILLLYLALGAVAGTMAGLFGIGGGLIITPVLIIAFRMQGVDDGVLTHMAVGTSLTTIVVTSLSSMRAHHEKGGVLWPLFRTFAPGIVIGVMLGVQTAATLNGPELQLLIGLYALGTAYYLAFGAKPNPSRELPRRFGLSGSGAFIGWASGIFGIGGGSLTVPFLYWCNVPMAKAVGTAAACGLPIALFGAGANVWTGWQKSGLPEWSTGYVFWPAVVGIVLMSTPCARFGAKLAHRLDPKTLRRAFSVFLLVVGAQLLYGAFPSN